jgi:ATP-dependent DNA ligase
MKRHRRNAHATLASLINPVPRDEPFDHGDWRFEIKFDGVRAAADTVRGQLISRNGNRMRRFEEVLDLLPKGCVGELVGASWRPTYLTFDF